MEQKQTVKQQFEAMKADIVRPIIQTHFNFRQFRHKGEINLQRSKTVPDETMSLRTIMERYAKGLPLSVHENVPMYDAGEDETYYPDPSKMDLAERQEYAENAKDEIDRINKKQNEHMRNKKKFDQSVIDFENDRKKSKEESEKKDEDKKSKP